MACWQRFRGVFQRCVETTLETEVTFTQNCQEDSDLFTKMFLLVTAFLLSLEVFPNFLLALKNRVGGFFTNPSEKYERQIGSSSPSRCEYVFQLSGSKNHPWEKHEMNQLNQHKQPSKTSLGLWRHNESLGFYRSFFSNKKITMWRKTMCFLHIFVQSLRQTCSKVFLLGRFFVGHQGSHMFSLQPGHLAATLGILVACRSGGLRFGVWCWYVFFGSKYLQKPKVFGREFHECNTRKPWRYPNHQSPSRPLNSIVEATEKPTLILVEFYFIHNSRGLFSWWSFPWLPGSPSR